MSSSSRSGVLKPSTTDNDGTPNDLAVAVSAMDGEAVYKIGDSHQQARHGRPAPTPTRDVSVPQSPVQRERERSESRKRSDSKSSLKRRDGSIKISKKVSMLPCELVNERIGPQSFQKLRLLGRGDVGKVYLVNLKNTDRLYAMKMMTKSEMIRRNKVRRVLTEREILSSANHPFIVTLYNCFQSQDRLYFIMDYCAGGEFFRTLQRQPHKCLKENDARFYAAEVLLALEYLHMIGFVYRDLKPENILMHDSGHLMLTDFDLSKASVSASSPKVVKNSGFSWSRKSQKSRGHLDVEPEVFTNSFVGTEEYIAPEVITGVGHTTAVDWWTLGILCYEMLFGVTPFRGKNREETFDRISSGQLKFPDYPIISSSCRNLIKRLLHVDPKKRLGSEHGAADLKSHPWFKNINWALIRNETPPIIPRLAHALDFSNFRALKDDDDPSRNSTESIEDDEDTENPFHHFSYQRSEEASYLPSPTRLKGGPSSSISSKPGSMSSKSALRA